MFTAQWFASLAAAVLARLLILSRYFLQARCVQPAAEPLSGGAGVGQHCFFIHASFSTIAVLSRKSNHPF
jgi:hypothetical protein